MLTSRDIPQIEVSILKGQLFLCGEVIEMQKILYMEFCEVNNFSTPDEMLTKEAKKYMEYQQDLYFIVHTVRRFPKHAPLSLSLR